MAQRTYAALPHEYLDEMEALTDAEFGRLTRALLKYSMVGEPIALCGNERFYAKRVMNREDRYIREYESMLERNRENGKKGGRPSNPVVFHDNPKNPPVFESGEKNQVVFSETQKTQTKAKAETKTKAKAKEDTYCTERGGPAAVSAPPPAVLLPLNDGSEYPVTAEAVAEWAKLYPAVDVMQELRSMRGWLASNPQRRKTKSGIQRFVNGWLAKEQNKGGTNRGRWDDELGALKGGGSDGGGNTVNLAKKWNLPPSALDAYKDL